MKTLTACAAALLLLTAAPATAAPMTEAEAALIVERGDRDKRDTDLDDSRMPARALAFARLEGGDRVLDMFAGGGYYTELLARAVGPDGRVIAQNPAAFGARERIKAAVEQRNYGERVPNAAVMNVDFMQMQLAPSSIDRAFFHLVYHDLYFESAEFGLPRTEPQIVLSELHRALRPGGSITVIDHVGDGDDPRTDVQATHRIKPDIVLNDFRKAGFRLAAREAFFDNPADNHAKSVFDPALRGKTDRFAMRFVKAGDPGAEETAAADIPAYGAGECDASAVADFLGKMPSAVDPDTLKRAFSASMLRMHKSGDAVTMDFRTDRVNVETSPETGEIVRIYCG
ncbi:methyltransferase domain-containing protein [Pacificimonas sp. WHA3]|uniref:Methyltransferase domain-containing protein n=1 Tax=Pacificimonas pallii TaxID=2827236 RepID=A0ABS6SD24_9SPHN|nr:I78 family peptidase inhibitor [Pacificimonas pallii]MBV7256008.1 methyltransferase domain-containing protein [Pacificimonas pallii]